MEKKTKRQIRTLFFGIILLIVIVIGMSYAYIRYESRQEEANVVGTECLKLSLIDESEAITIEKAIPISDEDGKKTKPYQFKVENNCNKIIDYNINLESLEIENRMDTKYIAVELDEEAKGILKEYKEAKAYYKDDEYIGVESHTLYSSFLNPYESKSHILRLWLDKDADNGSQEKNFLSKVVIEGTQNEVIASADYINIKNVDANEKEIKDLTITNSYAYTSTASLVCEEAKQDCYFKANGKVKVTGILLQSCGTEENPSTCVDLGEGEEITSGTWYKTKNNITIEPQENETNEIEVTSLTCIVDECSEKVKSTLAKQDRTAPVINVGTIDSNYQRAIINFEASDTESGIESISCKYGLTEENLDLEGTLENGVCTLGNLTIDSIYYYSIEGIDKIGNVKKMPGMISSKEVVTAPGLSGGSKEYATSRTITVSIPGSADTGVSTYEYYITRNKETPSTEVEVTGTTQDSVTISEEGTWYVYYRTVSNQGNRSSWSGEEEVNIYYKASSVEYTNSNYPEISNAQQAIEKIKEKWGIS